MSINFKKPALFSDANLLLIASLFLFLARKNMSGE